MGINIQLSAVQSLWKPLGLPEWQLPHHPLYSWITASSKLETHLAYLREKDTSLQAPLVSVTYAALTASPMIMSWMRSIATTSLAFNSTICRPGLIILWTVLYRPVLNYSFKLTQVFSWTVDNNGNQNKSSMWNKKIQARRRMHGWIPPAQNISHPLSKLMVRFIGQIYAYVSLFFPTTQLYT